MNLLPRVSKRLSKFSLAIECLGGQHTAEVVIVPWLLLRLWFEGSLSGMMGARSA